MLKERLLNDMKEAMKNKDTVRKNTIQLVRAAILNKEKDEQKELTDTEIEQIIQKQIKQRNDTIGMLLEHDRETEIADVQKEQEILSEYLPKPLTPEELDRIVTKVLAEGTFGPKQMGAVIKAVKEEVGTRAEGKAISEMVKEKLQ